MSDVELETLSSALPEPTEWDIRRWSALLGRGLVWLSLSLLALWTLDMMGFMPIRMPDFWYPVRSLWWVVGTAGLISGIKILQRDPRLGGWNPSHTGRRFNSVILYTREGCHLCDEAKELLETYGKFLPPISEVDIDKDAILIAKFTTCVPVVEIDGKIRFRGRIDEVLLRRLIEGSMPSR